MIWFCMNALGPVLDARDVEMFYSNNRYVNEIFPVSPLLALQTMPFLSDKSVSTICAFNKGASQAIVLIMS